MRWIFLIPLIALITSCILAEGSIVEEPEDVVIAPQMYQFKPEYPCQSVPVTKPERNVNCPH